MACVEGTHRQDEQQILVDMHASVVVQVHKVVSQAVCVTHLSSHHS